jgi:hypothetical protein
MTRARTYHAFWAIVNASYDPPTLRALTLDARRRYLLQDALQAHDARQGRRAA